MNMPRPSMLWIYGLIGAFIIGYYVFGDVNDTPVPSDWATVERMVEKGEVEKIQVVNRDQAQVFLPAQLPCPAAAHAAQAFEPAHPAVLPARQSEKFTQPSQHGVDSGGGMCFRKASPPLRGAAAGHRGLPVPAGEGSNAADVIFHRTGAALPLCQLPPECIDLPRRNRYGRSALSHTVSSQSF